MLKKNSSILKIVLCFFLVLSSIITIIDFCCFDKNFYHNEYSKLNTAKDIGVSDSDLDLMTDDLLDYLKGEKVNLDLQLPVKGKTREIFDEREKAHMIDVKDLYDNAILIRNISAIIVVVLVTILLIKKDFKELSNAYKKALLFYLFIFSFIGIFCLIDFNTFWISFHELFFTKNDYWLLDPSISIMINMVPEIFFFDLCIRIVVYILLSLILYYILFKIIDKKEIQND